MYFKDKKLNGSCQKVQVVETSHSHARQSEFCDAHLKMSAKAFLFSYMPQRCTTSWWLEEQFIDKQNYNKKNFSADFT